MYDIVYYYPLGSGAPSQVARNLFSALIEKNISFNIAVFTQNEKASSIFKDKYEDIPVISVKNLLDLSGTLVHFSVSPFIFPNKKFLAYLISRFKHNKLIINYHGDPQTEFKIGLANHNQKILLNFPNYLLMPYLVKNTDAIVLNSIVMKEQFHSSYGSTNFEVIPNGIDSTWIGSEKGMKTINENKMDNKNICLFYHGRLAPEKGVDLLLKAFSKVLGEYISSKPMVVLHIAGDGPQKDYLKKLVQTLKIDNNVIFLGKISKSNLKSYLYTADASIYPSTYEPFSLAVLEAFAVSNGPVMYASNMGINDFVKHDGYKFYTFTPTIEGISNAIRLIISKTYTPNICCKQKEFASKYTWDKIAQQYIDLYSKMLGE
jgi:glycosyltransferase involved in cell wall biosynthesis